MAVHRGRAQGPAADPTPAVAEALSGLTDRFPLSGKLYCRCGARFFAAWSVTPVREYRSVCGWRLRPICAATLEHRVIRKPAVISLTPADRGRTDSTELIDRRCQRIEIGRTLDHILVFTSP